MEARYKYEYGYIQDWSKWPTRVTSTQNIKSDQTSVSFKRERYSHQGISAYKSIRNLVAVGVNQEFLNEISELSNLRYLDMEVVTVDDLAPLKKLKQLKILKLYGIRKNVDISPLLLLKNLYSLFIENAKFVYSLDVFSEAHHLKALGIEGSMYTKQKIESLKPLSNLQSLEALFMASVQLKDKNLSYLAQIPNLQVLDCARFAPKEKFDELRTLMPNLKCNWCDQYEILLP